MKVKFFKITNLILAVALSFFVIGYTYAWLSSNLTHTLTLSGQSSGGYFAGGTGTSDDPFLIAEAQHLYNLSYLQNKGRFKDRQYYFEMIDDVDMSEGRYIIAPIGGYSYPFTGVFNGNGHTISNLVVSTNKNLLFSNDPASADSYIFSNAVGMFGQTADYSSTEVSDIKNFILYNPVVDVADKTGGYIKTLYPTQGNVVGKYVGLAIGYVKSKASSIGVYGGKLAVVRTGYSTVNSIIGYADEASSDLTGGGSDTGIFYPSESMVKTIVNANANLALGSSKQNNNGIWILSSPYGEMGSFSLTIKPTLNGEQTWVYKNGSYELTTSGIPLGAVYAGNQTSTVAYYGLNSAASGTVTTAETSTIKKKNNSVINKLSGYLRFSGGTESYSYDNIVDEAGKIYTSSYNVGSYGVRGNAIKFNITSSEAKVYVVAGSSGGARWLGLYKTTDKSSSSSLNYSSLSSFYSKYTCSVGHANGYKTSNGITTLIYYSSDYKPSTCTHGNDLRYDEEDGKIQIKCYSCGVKYSYSTDAFTDECLLHDGGMRLDYGLAQDGQSGINLNATVYFAGGDKGTDKDDKKNLPVPTYTYSDDSVTSAITINSLAGEKKSDNAYKTNGNFPIKLDSNGLATFTPNIDGDIIIHFKSKEAVTNIKVNGVAVDVTKGDTVGTDKDGNTVYEYTYTLQDAQRGQDYTIIKGNAEVSLAYLEFTSKNKYLSNKLTCTESDTAHNVYDFEVDQTKYKHDDCVCGKAITVEQEAQSIELTGDPVAMIALPSSDETKAIYAVFDFEKLGLSPGSYQIASTSMIVDIYYMRVDGTSGGNSAQKNVSGIDFIYKDVYLKQEGDNISFVVSTTNATYSATGTRITFTTSNSSSGVTLYFFRTDDGDTFMVGYYKDQPSGSAQMTQLDGALTLIDTNGNFNYDYSLWN